MFAAALVALMVGGPLGACLFLAYGVVHAMKVAKVDAKYADKGEVPPSYALINRWLDRKKAAGTAPKNAKPAKYGMWRYAWQRWQAMWEDMGVDFAEQREQEKRARAEAKEKGLPVPARRTAKDKAQSLKSWKWWLNGTPDPVAAATDGANRDANPPTSSVAPEESSTTATPDGPRTACEDCGQTLVQRGEAWEHPSSSGCPSPPAGNRAPRAEERADDDPKCPRCGSYRGPGADFCGTCTSTLAEDGRWRNLTRAEREAEDVAHIAQVRAAHTEGRNCRERGCPTCTTTEAPTPTGVGATETEGNTMTQTTTAPQQQSGEVVGLMSAINYANAVATAHEAHSTGGGEQYRSALGQAEVGPETIQSAAAAQEASEIAGAAWRLHEQKLKEQLAAKEATTAETGKKEFLLAE